MLCVWPYLKALHWPSRSNVLSVPTKAPVVEVEKARPSANPGSRTHSSPFEGQATRWCHHLAVWCRPAAAATLPLWRNTASPWQRHHSFYPLNPKDRRPSEKEGSRWDGGGWGDGGSGYIRDLPERKGWSLLRPNKATCIELDLAWASYFRPLWCRGTDQAFQQLSTEVKMHQDPAATTPFTTLCLSDSEWRSAKAERRRAFLESLKYICYAII